MRLAILSPAGGALSALHLGWEQAVGEGGRRQRKCVQLVQMGRGGATAEMFYAHTGCVTHGAREVAD